MKENRIIQEYVPGKQLTIAHIIANPDYQVLENIGVEHDYQVSVGIVTITPSEAAIIAVDIALKSAGVEIGFLDRFSGSIVLTGDLNSIKAAFEMIGEVFEEKLGFNKFEITQS